LDGFVYGGCRYIFAKIQNSITIGPEKFDTNIFLAPLAGCSDISLRLISREHGAKMCFFEMVDANSLVHGPVKSQDILFTTDKDKPIAGQILGDEPDLVLKASKKLLNLVSLKFLDINAACPVPKVIKKKSGSHLLRDPKTLYAIINKLATNLDLPVTVKLRVGYDKIDLKEIVSIAKNCEKSGAQALFVHGRTRNQFYSGEVDYQSIKAIKHAVKIPVFGSGNVFSPMMAKKMFDETDCDGILVARGSFGNPWIFKDIEDFIKTGKKPKEITFEERVKILKRHLSYAEKYRIKTYGKSGFMRKIVIWYMKGFRHAAKIRGDVAYAHSYEDLLRLVDSVPFPSS